VAKREDLATVGVNSYLSPGMCATKKAAGDMYGSRQKLWNMTLLYKEIEDFAAIFNVQSRGEALIADFKNVRMTCVKRSVRIKRISLLSSGSPVLPLLLMLT
jgi:iron complex transport system substrate-binding protein